ncbi:hypothetical protein GJ496_002737 [Pomphorhynchus laevis]|nr:hypothetical protein GJ496_002737 [Pomphorhynchus laevis]
MKPNDHSRLILTNNDTNADITLIKHRLVCVTHNAKLKDQIRDKLTPLKFIQNFSIVHKSNSEQVPLPTLNESVSNKVEFEVRICNIEDNYLI